MAASLYGDKPDLRQASHTWISYPIHHTVDVNGGHPYTRWITGNASSIVVTGNTSRQPRRRSSPPHIP